MDKIEFNRLEKITFDKISEQFLELEGYCENYPEINEFVSIVTYPMLNPLNADKLNFEISDNLCTLIWQITNYDLRSAIYNEYHFRGDWVYFLNSFIGNYFLDDSYFTLETGIWDTWTALVATDQEVISQNPYVLIEAAKDNANFFIKSGTLKGHEYLEFIKTGMQSSGNVEKLLNDE